MQRRLATGAPLGGAAGVGLAGPSAGAFGGPHLRVAEAQAQVPDVDAAGVPLA